MDPWTLLASIPGIGPYLPWITAVVTVCAALAMIAPGPQATGWTSSPVYRFVYAMLQWCALNKGHATALSSPAATGIVGGGGAISNPQVATASVPKPMT